MTDYRSLMAQLEERARTVREFAGSSSSKATLDFLDSLEASYLEDLRSVKPEGLERLQGQIAQTNAIRDVLLRKQTCGRV